ncbi:hypothetical protein QJQ45_001486 [Haematococcus lacustris]|nr:hypothetical protein QJQ45_001486 [Haematococcus lacustris]
MAAVMLKSLGSTGLLAAGPARQVRTRVATTKQELGTQSDSDSRSSAPALEEQYIGFPKNDYAPRAGRKGRVIVDDARKYPTRDALVGGWAGGEAGLWQLREQIKAEESTLTDANVIAPKSPVRQPVKSKWQSVKPVSSAGKDAIYVGFGKDELELRKSGMQGRVIYDEAYKYPDREDIGFFKCAACARIAVQGVIGGFAGGEPALKEFAETGELKLRKPGQPGPIKKQFSPLILAFLIIFAAAGGGVLLTTAFDLGDAGVQQILQAPTDETTKSLLLVAVALIGTSAAVGGLRALFVALQAKLSQGAEGASRLVVQAAFFVAVLLVARSILSS